MNVKIHVTDLGTPAVQGVINRLGNTRDLNATIATQAEKTTVSYIAKIALGRHKTAQSLGATPTGELERAALRVTSSFSDTVATVEVPRFLFARAFGDITIRPTGGKKFLTIPLSSASYGKTAGELRMAGWKIFRPGKFQILLGYLGKLPKGQPATKLFALARSAFQKQDRTLLPSDETYRAEARVAATTYALALAQ